MTDPEIPEARHLRWPILVVLDQMAEGSTIHELQERVMRHLDLPPEAVDVLDPDTGRSLLMGRLLQAVADLYQAGAVDGSDDATRLWITDVGRRLTENDMEELANGDAGSSTSPAQPHERDSIADWIGALFEAFFTL